jgi:hypothetical protein
VPNSVTIGLECSGFTGVFEALNSSSQLPLHPLAFRRANFTLGSPNADDLEGRGWRRNQFRRAMGHALTGLLVWDEGRLKLAEDFVDLDRTEKAGVSFWVGSAITFLVAQQKLGVTWLAHVDQLLTRGILRRVGNTRITPDFSGFGHGNAWHVLESKGRSSGYDSTVVEGAKAQASKVEDINGSPPQTSSACVVSLNTAGTTVLLSDPEPSREGQRWSIEPESFLQFYYSGIRYLLASRRTETVELDGRKYRSTVLQDPDFCDPFSSSARSPKLRIGLLESIFFARTNLAQRLTEGLVPGEGIGPDGIAVFE